MKVPSHGRGKVRLGSLPGNKGGTGRPPNAFKARMKALADRWAQAAEAKKILDNPEHPYWMHAGRFAAEHGYGKPEQSVQVSTPEPLTIRVVHE